jgi:hypothetical protein
MLYFILNHYHNSKKSVVVSFQHAVTRTIFSKTTSTTFPQQQRPQCGWLSQQSSSYIPSVTVHPLFHRPRHTKTQFCVVTAPTTTHSFSSSFTTSATTNAVSEEDDDEHEEESDDNNMSTKTPSFPKFQDIEELHPALKRNLNLLKLETMTEIQAKTWEAASDGQDVLGRARTGTGKTVAFLLPAIQQLLLRNDTKAVADQTKIQMLVLSPTRE